MRPQVVAHRGASGVEAEHTLAAYSQAIADGADALECDVRLTRDHVLVCVHDRRVDRTSSGRGVVSTLELQELTELDFGAWKRPDPLLTADWEEPDLDRSGVLTLERLLQTVLDCDRRVELAVETKHPTRYGAQVEQSLVALLERYGLTAPDAQGRHRVRVMSFAPTSLRRVHLLAPALPTVLLMRRVPVRYRTGLLPNRVPIAGPGLEALRATPEFVRRAHERGRQVHVWTVNEPDDLQFALELRVDAVITDRPAAVLRLLGA